MAKLARSPCKLPDSLHISVLAHAVMYDDCTPTARASLG